MSELNNILPFGITIEIPYDSTISNTEQRCEAHENMQEALIRLILDDAKAMINKIENYPPLLKIAQYNSKKRNNVRGDWIEVKFNTLVNGLG